MSVKWTAEQQQVIDLRGKNILVSAAAGSGKTAVLVERIISRITSDINPVDVDRLLIVTFTEAAAAEMKERIAAAIEKRLEETPGDERLQRQATLIHTALITTIHSFCLTVFREHFHAIGVDPGMRVAEEGELKLLRQDVMDEMLEEFYASGDSAFLDFIERFGTGRNDRKVEEIILRLYEYSRSYPQPEKWLDSCADAYGKEEEEETGRAELFRQLCRHIHSQMPAVCSLIRRGLQVCREPDGPYMYAEMLASDLNCAQKMLEAETEEEMRSAADGFVWKRLSGKKDEQVDDGKRNSVKKLREEAKKLVQDITDTFLYDSMDQMWKDMQAARPSIRMLTCLVRRFSEMFREKKISRNVMDFSDMEQFALEILTEERGGELVPSPVAAEYRARFEEVMIDEYQDSNLVQETILTSVSGIPDGKYNIFMVGDVKQSIYSFRLSRPALFLEKYHTYSKDEGNCRRIDLHRNFRSRTEVLDSVNYIFREIMKESLGGIKYDDDAALYPGASFPETEREGEFCTELLLLDKSDMGEDSERKAEARMIAERIRQLVETGRVAGAEEGTYRRIRYRDIVVLTRSVKGWAEDLVSVFAEEGIPAYSVSREGYFETYEVSVLLDYLKILSNARQDLPLTAVLTSCFGSLTAEELAEIRLAFPNLPFYEAAVMYAKGEAVPDYEGAGRLQEKLRHFYEEAAYFRKRVPYTPIHELVEQIVERTGFGVYISAMPAGAQREANIDMLMEKAAAFESTSYKGLFHFIRYIEQLKKYNVDYGEAGIMDEQSDTVRVMSIHKSKGLEFPVVFAAGMGKRFNVQDTRGSVILHPEWGVGLDDIDLKKRTRMPTLLKRMMRRDSALETLGEELRILYVALTRAKEKLIITGAADGKDAASAAAGTGVMRADRASCCLDWLIPVLLKPAPEGQFFVREDAPFQLRMYSAGGLKKNAAALKAEELALDVLQNWDASAEYDPDFAESLREEMEYQYPFRNEERMKLKFTVSELKKRKEPAEEAGEELYAEQVPVPLIPRFLQQKEELRGASRGSAYHKLLELLDFTMSYNETGLRETIQTFREAGRLTGEMADCIRTEDILFFLESESGKRMHAAALRNGLYREQPFVIGMDAERVYPGEPKGEIILVQGIIDVYLKEPDGLVVLDYKTDRVSEESELAEKYHLQLDYYAEALERLTGRPVKEKIIYSFTLRKEIKL